MDIKNTGNRNTGYMNTGNRNTGNWNTGDWNTGNMNTGNRNTGNWNTGNCNTGYMNTLTPKVVMFNKITNLDFEDIEFPSFFYFKTILWITEDDMTKKEKDSYPSYATTGGYLKCMDYKQSFIESYKNSSDEDRESVKNLPNFDAEIFFEISGIRVDEEKKKVTLELTDEQLEQIKEIIN